MTLYEYIKMSRDDEITVWDKDYDVETYFYKTDEKDAWDKACCEFSKLLTVTEFSKIGVTVNMAEVIKNNIPKLKKTDLFIIHDIDVIMSDIEAILAGNVSEKWLTQFVNVLRKEN